MLSPTLFLNALLIKLQASGLGPSINNFYHSTLEGFCMQMIFVHMKGRFLFQVDEEQVIAERPYDVS